MPEGRCFLSIDPGLRVLPIASMSALRCGGQRDLAWQEPMRDADDGLRVVALAVVGQDVLAGAVEAVTTQEFFLAKLVVLRDRRKHRLTSDVPIRHG